MMSLPAPAQNAPPEAKVVPAAGAASGRAASSKDGRGQDFLGRLKLAEGGRLPDAPWGGALVRIDRDHYEPARLTISSFSIHPYEGPLIAGQMFQCAILLPGADEPFEVQLTGAVKTLDATFGLRAIFASPQPYAQRALAKHLMTLREVPVAPPPRKRRSLWG